MHLFEEQRFHAKLRAGDHAAFDLLFERHAPQVLGFLRNLTGSRAEAEDLTQDVFLAAYSAHASFEGRAKPVSWLLGIAVRRWRDCGRRGRLLMSSLDENSAKSSLSRQPAPDTQVIEAVTLSAALLVLTPPNRAALLLVASSGFTYREAAEILGEPVGTVKWRVSESSRKMREILMQKGEEQNETRSATSGASQ